MRLIQKDRTLSAVAKLDFDSFKEMHLERGLDDLSTATMVVSFSFKKLFFAMQVNL